MKMSIKIIALFALSLIGANAFATIRHVTLDSIIPVGGNQIRIGDVTVAHCLQLKGDKAVLDQVPACILLYRFLNEDALKTDPRIGGVVAYLEQQVKVKIDIEQLTHFYEESIRTVIQGDMNRLEELIKTGPDMIGYCWNWAGDRATLQWIETNKGPAPEKSNNPLDSTIVFHDPGKTREVKIKEFTFADYVSLMVKDVPIERHKLSALSYRFVHDESFKKAARFQEIKDWLDESLYSFFQFDLLQERESALREVDMNCLQECCDQVKQAYENEIIQELANNDLNAGNSILQWGQYQAQHKMLNDIEKMNPSERAAEIKNIDAQKNNNPQNSSQNNSSQSKTPQAKTYDQATIKKGAAIVRVCIAAYFVRWVYNKWQAKKEKDERKKREAELNKNSKADPLYR